MSESHTPVPFIIPEAPTAHIRRKRFDLPYAHVSPAQKLDIYWPAEGESSCVLSELRQRCRSY